MMYSPLVLALGMTAAAAATCPGEVPRISADFHLQVKAGDSVSFLGSSLNGTDDAFETVYLYRVAEDLAAKAYTVSTSQGTSLNVRTGANFTGLQIPSVFNTYDDKVVVKGFVGYEPGDEWYVNAGDIITHRLSQAYEQFYRTLNNVAVEVLYSGTPKKDGSAPDGGCTAVKLYKTAI